MLRVSNLKRRRTENPGKSDNVSASTSTDGTSTKNISSTPSLNGPPSKFAKGLNDMEKFLNSSLSSSTVSEYKVNE